MNREFKLSYQAHVATSFNYNENKPNAVEDFSLIVRQISIDKLAEEPKKLNPHVKPTTKIDKNPHDSLVKSYLEPLLKPKEGQDLDPTSKFSFSKESIIKLANECANIFSAQPIVIKDIKPPAKIVGDIFG